jgi:hypothetical protein
MAKGSAPTSIGVAGAFVAVSIGVTLFEELSVT